MLKHLFKLIWNKKKQNFLFLSEIFVSFFVIFVLFSFLTYYYQNYKKEAGFNADQVWSVNYSSPLDTKNADSLKMFFENVRGNIKSLPKVLSVSYSAGNTPYSGSYSSTNLEIKGKKYNYINTYNIEKEYADVLKIKVLEGRWYNSADRNQLYQPVVINNSFKEEAFGKQDAVGQIIGKKDDKVRMKIIGVIQDMKVGGDYKPSGKAMYTQLDTAAFGWIRKILIRVTPDADAAFESRLYKTIAGTMTNSTIEISHLSDQHKTMNQSTKTPMIIFMIVAGFLIINVALGLFGVLWYNISKRRGEIGLRRAIGASGKSVAYQLVTESLLLATLALITGCFFAVQFPLLNVFDIAAGIYFIAMAFSVLFIYVLVFICSLYPGSQAAAIHPAVALHEE